MTHRSPYHDHVDPDYQRWGKRYPRFPGVAECVRLIRSKKAKGTWVDIIVHELAMNSASCLPELSASCLPELIAAYREGASDAVSLYVMMALDVTKVPAAVPFLEEVLREETSVSRHTRDVPWKALILTKHPRPFGMLSRLGRCRINTVSFSLVLSATDRIRLTEK